MGPLVTDDKSVIEEEEGGAAWDSKFQYLLALLGWAVGLGKFFDFEKKIFKFQT